MFFNKSPAATRKDGLAQMGWVLLGILFAFLPFFSLAPLFSEIGMGWLFFEDEESRKSFNEVYTTMYDEYSYFGFVIVPFVRIFKNFSLEYIIDILFFLWVLWLYKNLIYRDRFAPFLIHPNRIKKSFFTELRYKFFNFLKQPIPQLLGGLGAFFYWTFGSFIILFFITDLNYLFWDKLGFFVETIDTSMATVTIPAYFLDVSAKFLIPYLVIWIEVSLPVTKQIITESKSFRKFNSMGRPSARWGGVSSYIRHDFDTLINLNKKKFVNTEEKTGIKNPIYLGTTNLFSDPKLGGRNFGLNTDSHMLTIAQTGSGKSRDVLHTNFALWPNGLFILDPKGEHAQRTYELRKKAGFPVYLIDPYGLAKSVAKTDCLNPLAEIDPNSPSAADDIQTITYACIPPDDNESGNAKHFRETAQMLFAGLVAHVLTRYPEEEQTLTTIFDLFLSGKADGTLINQEGFYKVLGEMAGNPACGKLPMQGVAMLLSIKEGERGSIYSTFMRSVAWTQSEVIKKVLSHSTFSLDDIKSKQATVYLVLPFGHMRAQSRWVRCIIGLCFKRAEFPRTPTDTDKKSLFVLDEFLQLETFRAVQDAFTTLRGAGVKLWLLTQSLTDIKEFYSNHKSMIGACDKQFFGTDEPDDTKYIENLLGEYQRIVEEGHEGETSTKREIDKLCTASEISQLIAKSEQAGEGYQIIKPTDGLPLILDLVPCYWVLDQSRYGDFKQVFVPPYKEEQSNDETKQEFLSPEEVVRILKGESKKVTDKSEPKATGGIPDRGERGPIGREVDSLKLQLNDMREELNQLKKREN